MNNKVPPLVTVISPCYNHAKYVIASLESVRNQRYDNIEHIIIDDCSKDNSVALIEEWITANNYKCIFIKHEVNKGLAYTLNEGIKLAKGEFINPLATDDIMLPEKTTNVIAQFDDEKIGMVVTDAAMIDENGKLMELMGYSSFTEYHLRDRKEILSDNKYGDYDTLLEGNYLASSYIIRKNCFYKCGFYNEDLFMEDWEMWLRLRQKFLVKYLPQKLSLYRIHPTNNVKKIPRPDTYLTLALQKKYALSHGYKKLFMELVYKKYGHAKRNGLVKEKQILLSSFSMYERSYLLVRYYSDKIYRKLVS